MKTPGDANTGWCKNLTRAIFQAFWKNSFRNWLVHRRSGISPHYISVSLCNQFKFSIINNCSVNSRPRLFDASYCERDPQIGHHFYTGGRLKILTLTSLCLCTNVDSNFHDNRFKFVAVIVR